VRDAGLLLTFGLMKNAKNLSRRRKAEEVAGDDEENGDIATVAGFILCSEISREREEEKEKEEKKKNKKADKSERKRREK
jgi:hypothetical protein